MHSEIPTLSQTENSLLPTPSPPASAPSADTAAETDAAAIVDSIPAPTTPPHPFVRITIPDYLGGIADLTGEMMRLAIGSVGKNLVVPSAEGQAVKKGGEELPSIESIGKMVRDIKGGECFSARERAVEVELTLRLRRDGPVGSLLSLVGQEDDGAGSELG